MRTCYTLTHTRTTVRGVIQAADLHLHTLITMSDFIIFQLYFMRVFLQLLKYSNISSIQKPHHVLPNSFALNTSPSPRRRLPTPPTAQISRISLALQRLITRPIAPSIPHIQLSRFLIPIHPSSHQSRYFTLAPFLPQRHLLDNPHHLFPRAFRIPSFKHPSRASSQTLPDATNHHSSPCP